MDYALRVLAAVGPTGNDVVIGHDFGAVAATGLAAMPESPFTKAVTMAAPPYAAFRRSVVSRTWVHSRYNSHGKP